MITVFMEAPSFHSKLPLQSQLHHSIDFKNARASEIFSTLWVQGTDAEILRMLFHDLMPIWFADKSNINVSQQTNLIQNFINDYKMILLNNQSIIYYSMFMFSGLTSLFVQILKNQLDHDEFMKLAEESRDQLNRIIQPPVSEDLKKLNPTLEEDIQYVQNFFYTHRSAIIGQSVLNAQTDLHSLQTHLISNMDSHFQSLQMQQPFSSYQMPPTPEFTTHFPTHTHFAYQLAAVLQVSHNQISATGTNGQRITCLQPAPFLTKDAFLQLNPNVEQEFAKRMYDSLYDLEVLDDERIVEKMTLFIEDLKPFDKNVTNAIYRAFLYFPGAIHQLLSTLFDWIINSKQIHYFDHFLKALDDLSFFSETKTDRAAVLDWKVLMHHIAKHLSLYFVDKSQKNLLNAMDDLLECCSSSPLYSIQQILQEYLQVDQMWEHKQELNRKAKVYEKQEKFLRANKMLDFKTKASMLTHLAVFWDACTSQTDKYKSIDTLIGIVGTQDSKVLSALLHFPNAISFFVARLFYFTLMLPARNKKNLFDILKYLSNYSRSNKNRNEDSIKFRLWVSFFSKIFENLNQHIESHAVQELRVMYNQTFHFFNDQVEEGRRARKMIQTAFLQLMIFHKNEFDRLIGQSENQLKCSSMDNVLDTLYGYLVLTSRYPQAQTKVINLITAVFSESILVTANHRSLIPCPAVTFYEKFWANQELAGAVTQIVIKTLLASEQPDLKKIIQLPIQEFGNLSEINDFLSIINMVSEFVAAIRFIEPYFYEYHQMRKLRSIDFDQLITTVTKIVQLDSSDNSILSHIKTVFMEDCNDLLNKQIALENPLLPTIFIQPSETQLSPPSTPAASIHPQQLTSIPPIPEVERGNRKRKADAGGQKEQASYIYLG